MGGVYAWPGRPPTMKTIVGLSSATASRRTPGRACSSSPTPSSTVSPSQTNRACPSTTRYSSSFCSPSPSSSCGTTSNSPSCASKALTPKDSTPRKPRTSWVLRFSCGNRSPASAQRARMCGARSSIPLRYSSLEKPGASEEPGISRSCQTFQPRSIIARSLVGLYGSRRERLGAVPDPRERFLIRYAGGFAPFLAARAEGAWVETADGRRVLDFTSGQICSTLGHNHPRIGDAVRRALDEVVHLNSWMLSEPVLALGERLAALLPAGLDKVVLLNTRPEANEVALKLPKMHTGPF